MAPVSRSRSARVARPSQSQSPVTMSSAPAPIAQRTEPAARTPSVKRRASGQPSPSTSARSCPSMAGQTGASGFAGGRGVARAIGGADLSEDGDPPRAVMTPTVMATPSDTTAARAGARRSQRERFNPRCAGCAGRSGRAASVACGTAARTSAATVAADGRRAPSGLDARRESASSAAAGPCLRSMRPRDCAGGTLASIQRINAPSA